MNRHAEMLKGLPVRETRNKAQQIYFHLLDAAVVFGGRQRYNPGPQPPHCRKGWYFVGGTPPRNRKPFMRDGEVLTRAERKAEARAQFLRNWTGEQRTGSY